MTSQPEVPGAPAVILFHDEIVEDVDGTWTYYTRIKILNQAGRDHFSNISIQYPAGNNEDDFNVTNVAARTIHADGSVVPFTGVPFDRLVEKSSSTKTREKIFALPDVQIGSIIEYRYTLQLNADIALTGFSNEAFIPTFYAQSELFARKESFLWHTDRRGVGLTSTLPGGAAAVKITAADASTHYSNYNVSLENVLPVVDEPFMPPLRSLVQKVIFYTSLRDSFRTPEDFWTYYGKVWTKSIDSFIGSPSRLSAAAAEMTAGATTPEDKLRKIYAAVQGLENTNFSRERSAREKKVMGVSTIKSANDVLAQKRGDDFQLTILFVGLVRSSGMNAYILSVANRDVALFDPAIITFRQLDDDLAIVELDGKDLFLDPAEPFCPFGHLLWTHSDAGGLRQTATGTSLSRSPPSTFKDSETRRVANLTLDSNGQETGTVDLSFAGAPALAWRQSTLVDDEIALHKNLETYLRTRLPANTEVALQTVDNLSAAAKPLIVRFKISGPLGSTAGKQRLLPTQLFQTNQRSPFLDEKRTLPVAFPYPERIVDGVRLQFPSTWHIETSPTPETDTVPALAIAYDSHAQISASAIVFRRDYILGATVVAPTSYPDLRNFYGKVASKDQEQFLIHTSPRP